MLPLLGAAPPPSPPQPLFLLVEVVFFFIRESIIFYYSAITGHFPQMLEVRPLRDRATSTITSTAPFELRFEYVCETCATGIRS